MTAKIIFGSNKLGSIPDEWLQAMLDKFHLGTLTTAKKTVEGAMGQTMFVSSTAGDSVLKGNPLYDGQLEEEKFFIEQVKQRTNIPVPTPYLIDHSTDIYGWSYALMPLLPGQHVNDVEIQLSNKDKLNIAASIAHKLSVLHQWNVSNFGELNPKTKEITSFTPNYYEWLSNRMLYWLEDAKKYSTVTRQDISWTKSLLADSKEAFHRIPFPTFVMGDFKPGNFLVHRENNGWDISGVFDFTNAYFADPLSDLIKMLSHYLDNDEKASASQLIEIYFGKLEVKQDIIHRLKVHMVHQRILDWGNAKATKTVTWDDKLPFYKWAGKYTEFVNALFFK